METLRGIREQLERRGKPLPFELSETLGGGILITYPEGGCTAMAESIEHVVLSHHRMQTAGFSVSTAGVGEGIKLNYCLAGRLEISMGDGHTMFMGPGDFSVETATAWRFSFPCAFYEGIEIFIPAGCFDEPPQLFVEAGLDLRGITARLSTPAMRNWTRRASEETKRLFCSLLLQANANWSEPARLRLGIAQLLLQLAEEGTPQRETDSSLFTRRQIELARQAEALLAGDLSHRRSIASVAAELGVKPTALNSCFKGVYGANISDYLLERRMLRAEELLARTNRPVADIARAVGYANPGKFCEAFRKHAGATPLQWRKAR